MGLDHGRRDQRGNRRVETRLKTHGVQLSVLHIDACMAAIR